MGHFTQVIWCHDIFSTCHFFIKAFCHLLQIDLVRFKHFSFVILSLVILLMGHYIVNLSFSLSVILAIGHFANQSFCLFVIFPASVCHTSVSHIYLGKISVCQMSIVQMSVSKKSVSQIPVNQMPVNQMSTRQYQSTKGLLAKCQSF